MTFQPPQTPSPPPFQQQQQQQGNNAPQYGTAKDLVTRNQDIRNETNNTQLDSSEIANSQVNVQQNFNSGNFQEEWLMENFSVRPRHEISASVTTNHRGDTYATVQYTHRFGVPKIAKKVREARLRGYEQKLARQNMQSQIAWQTHCVKSINAGYVPSGCEDVYSRKIAKAQPVIPSEPLKPTPVSTQGESVRGYY